MKEVKFSKRVDEVSTKGANHACVGRERRKPTRPTRETSLAYCRGCNRMISRIWLMKPRRYALVSLNWSGTSTVGSRTYGWEEDVVGLGADGGCDSVGGGFLEVPDCNSLNDSRRISFSSWSCCKTAMTWFKTVTDMVARRGRRWTNCHRQV